MPASIHHHGSTGLIHTSYGHLDYKAFATLLNGQTAILVVKNFFPATQAMAHALLNHPDFCFFGHEKVGYQGASFADAIRKNQRREYFLKTEAETKKVHEQLPAFKKLHYELDAMWPSGAWLDELDRQKMAGGTIRRFFPGKRIDPHMDALSQDYPIEWTQSIQKQIACNLFPVTPEHGGRTHLWEYVRFSDQEYLEKKRAGSYGFGWETFEKQHGPASAINVPEPGDAVFFDARAIHAVEAVIDGDRVTGSIFINFRGWNEPLRSYS